MSDGGDLVNGAGAVQIAGFDTCRVRLVDDGPRFRNIGIGERQSEVAILPVLDINAKFLVEVFPDPDRRFRERQLGGMAARLAHARQSPTRGHACQIVTLQKENLHAAFREVVRGGRPADATADDDDVRRHEGLYSLLVVSDRCA